MTRPNDGTLSVYLHVAAETKWSAVNAAAFSVETRGLALLFPSSAERRAWVVSVLDAIAANTSTTDRDALRDVLETWLGER